MKCSSGLYALILDATAAFDKVSVISLLGKLWDRKVPFEFIRINYNNRTFFDLQVANSPGKLRFEANLSREDSQSTEHSQKPEMISCREDSLIKKSLIK